MRPILRPDSIPGLCWLDADGQHLDKLAHIRKHISVLLLVLFSCYFSGISLFPHTHIVNGGQVAHSHLGGSASHNHSDAQIKLIEFLSQFCADDIVEYCHVQTQQLQLSEVYTGYQQSTLEGSSYTLSLRGPPQA